MPLQRCQADGKAGWKYGPSGHCYTGPGAKKKAIRQGVAIQEGGGPPFESRKDTKKSKAELTEAKLDTAVARLITPEEEKRDNLEREMMDRVTRLSRPEF